MTMNFGPRWGVPRRPRSFTGIKLHCLYEVENDEEGVMGLGTWTQYALELMDETFCAALRQAHPELENAAP